MISLLAFFASSSLVADIGPTIKWELERSDIYSIAINMPEQMRPGIVSGFDDAKNNPECGSTALRISSRSMKSIEGLSGAWESFKITFKVSKEVVKLIYGVKYIGDIADLFIKYIDSDSPGDFAKKTGEFVTGKLSEKGATLIGSQIGKTGSELQKAAKELSTSYVFTKTTSESAKYSFRKLLSSGSAPFAKGRFTYPGCGDVETNFYITSNHLGLELHTVIVGDCNYQEQYGGATLGIFQAHGRFQLEIEKRKVGNYQAITIFGIPTSGRWEVAARCNKAENEPIEPPEEEDEFIPTDAFTSSDLICTKIGYDLYSLFEVRKASATFYEQQASKDYQKYLDYIQKVEEYEEKAIKATNPARKKEFQNLANSWKKRAEVWNKSYRFKRLKSKNTMSLADSTKQAYKEKLRTCIKTECSRGEKFGSGGSGSLAPDWTSTLKKDIQSLITEMLDEEEINSQCYLGSKIWLSKKSFIPEEEIKVNFLTKDFVDPWIGLFRGDEIIAEASWQDPNIIEKHGTSGYLEGVLKFKAPLKPGHYKFLLFKKPENAKQIAKASFNVTPLVSDSKCGDRPVISGDQVYDRILGYERTVKWYTKQVKDSFTGTSVFSEVWDLTRADRFFSLHDWAITYIRMQISWIFDPNGPKSKKVLKRQLLSLHAKVRKYEKKAKTVIDILERLKELKDSSADSSQIVVLQRELEAFHFKKVFSTFPITCSK